MKRSSLWAGLLGALGLGALLRRASRGGAMELSESPADELRAKLAESRTTVDEREVDEAGETPVDAAADPPASAVDERRRDVHDRARKAADELG